MTDTFSKLTLLAFLLKLAVPTVLVCSILALVGCGPAQTSAAPPLLSPTQTSLARQRWPEATPQSLAAGHDLFVAKCRGCHGYPDIASISDERWPRIVRNMAPRATLTAAQGDDVLRFILAARTDLAPVP